MDIFRLGLRNILGLTMPGAILVFTVYYALIRCVIMFGLNPSDYWWAKDQGFIAFTVFFTISYITGALFRLQAADRIDEKSQKILLKEYFHIYAPEKEFIDELIKTYKKLIDIVNDDKIVMRLWNDNLNAIFNKVKDPKPNTLKTFKWIKKIFKYPYDRLIKFKLVSILVDCVKKFESYNRHRISSQLKELSANTDKYKFNIAFDRWVYRVERFPYTIWQLRKYEHFYNNDVLKFFVNNYKRCMRDVRGIGEKEFFNYAKTSIIEHTTKMNDSIKDELHKEEATVRFFAGTYLAINKSLYVLIPLLLLQVFVFSSIQFTDDFRNMAKPIPVIDSLITFFNTKSTESAYMSQLNNKAENTSDQQSENNPTNSNEEKKFNKESILFHVLITLALSILAWRIQKPILRRFRTIRIKEVDTVYDMFYLIEKEKQKS